MCLLSGLYEAKVVEPKMEIDDVFLEQTSLNPLVTETRVVDV